MNLSSDFTISSPFEEVWNGLVDVEEIAPCIPGFTLEEADGEEFHGKMKVKIGAIAMSYKATIRFAERDDEAHRVVISAKGQEIGGQGSVDALVTAELAEHDDGVKVTMSTELSITGRVAQFGRGIIADVSNRLIKQFVKSFEAKLAAPPSAEASVDTGEPAALNGAPPPPPPENEPLDMVGVAAWPLARRMLPVVGVLLALILLGRMARR